MIHSWSIVLLFLCTAGVTTLRAQQASRATPATQGGTPRATATSAAAAGPRLTPAWPRFEASVSDRSTAARSPLASSGDSHTLTFSTLALVIIGAVVLLLVLK